VVTLGDGTKVVLSESSDPNHPEMWYSTDGSHIQLNQLTKILTYKNGTQVQYAAFPSNSSTCTGVCSFRWRPVGVKDRNGNYFNIAYVAGFDQLISQVSDSLGRVITFNYDSSNHLTSLTQATHSSGIKTYASFQWGTIALNYAFASPLVVTNGPAQSFFSGITVGVLTGCTYPNQAGYKFTYGDWGIISKIETLAAPATQGATGATRSYVSYNFPPVSQGALTDAPSYTQQVSSPDGGSANNSVWGYSTTKDATGSVTSTTVTNPDGTVTKTTLDPTTGYTTKVELKDSSGTVLHTDDYTWTSTGSPPVSNVLGSVVTTNDAGQQSKVAYGYDPWANITDVSEYDFGLALKRHVVTTYKTVGDYVTRHIVELPTQILIKDGAGNTIGRTDMDYDGTTLTSVLGANNHDDQAYDLGLTTRGNLTSQTRYVNASAGTGGITRTFSYNTLGNLLVSQVDCCIQKTSTFSSTTQYSVPDAVTRGPANGTQFTLNYTYDPDNNNLLSVMDENGQITQYQYDAMNRLTQTVLPPQNGTSVQLTTGYDDIAVSPTITSSSTANNAVTVTTTDGRGQVLQVDTKNCPMGQPSCSTVVSSVKYAYNNMGQRTQTSNPFAPKDTVFNTTIAYDSQGRVTQMTPPSGGFTQYAYSGNSVTTTDPAGKQRTSISDAFGNVVEVDEPIPGTPVNSGSGSATINGTEQSVQVLVTPAAAGSGSVTLGGTVQWSAAASASTGGTTNITINGAEQQRPVGVIAGTGSVTLSGSEQVLPATTASATVTIGGSLQSLQVQTQAATQATASVTISGSESSTTISGPGCSAQTPGPPIGFICTERTVYDSGTVTITVNGHSDSAGYGMSSTTSTIASALAQAINQDASAPVTASASGAVVFLASKVASSSANSYSLSTSAATNDVPDFGSASFWGTTSAASLGGGQDAAYKTVYDFGSATITANGHGDGSSWSGSGTTAASIASSLVSAINGDSAAAVTASASGGTITLTAKTPGAAGNVSLGCSSSFDSADFAQASFTFSCPAALSGGRDPIYDSGTMGITVNGHTNSVAFNSSSNPTSLASALAANINADTGASVTATSSGAVVNLTATTKGSISNYSLSVPPVTYDSAHFSSSSFGAAASGPNLTGGWPNPNAIDNGSMTVTVNSTAYNVTWGSTATPGSIASALASALGSDPSVTPTLAGSTIYLDPKQPGASYSFSTAHTWDSGDFTQSSFTTANSISDYGTASVNVSGHSESVPWAGHSTAASVASALANQVNGDAAALVSASVSGSAMLLTSKTKGAGTNYTLASAESFDSTHFSSSSFSNTNSGATLAGGADAVYNTVYDAGTVWVEVNGFQANAPYTQTSTAASIASALANQFNGTGSPVTATVSGATLTLTASQKGSATNYSLSSGATTSQSGTFAQPSFAAGVSADSLTGGSDTAPTWQATTYSYDVLNNLTQVTQGAQTRSYGYDGLGRATSSTTPESGTVTTYYTDVNGNACAGDPTLGCRVQDARGVIKTNTYDGINRIAGVSYSDGTPGVSYQYDSGGAAAFALDRITKITEGANSQTFTYDNLGHVTSVSQVIDQTTYLVKYAYNPAGQVRLITYPSGRVVAQDVDAIGRVSSVSDGSATYLKSLTYNAAGEPLGLTLGNGVQGSFTYNDHLQIAGLRYYTGAPSDVLNLQYDYGTNNGQVQSVRYYTAPGIEDTAKSQYFEYDLLGRLSTAHTGQVTATAGTWALAWGYDRWGNRTSQTLVAGDPALQVYQPNFVIDSSTNRITSYCYDSAGNLLDETSCPTGAHQYAYDGANRMQQINGGATYTYFGAFRIKAINAGTTTVYIYSGGEPIAEYVNGSLDKEYIYAESQILATVSGNNTTYHHPAHLSNRAETDPLGKVIRTYGHFPYGETWYETGTPDKWKFTSYERDSRAGETGLDYAQFRYYDSAQARFMSPDPLAGSQGAPQSLNRYAYVANDPINSTDAQGLWCDGDGHGVCDPWAAHGGGFLGLDWFTVWQIANTPTFGIITPNPEWSINNDQPMAFLWLYYGSWDIAGLIGLDLSVQDAVKLGRELGPNARSLKTCKDALKTAHADLKGLQRADNNWNALTTAGSANGIPPEMLGAIGLRESDFTPNAIQSDGHGRGAFQIDCCGDIGERAPAHPDVSQKDAFDVGFSSRFASNLLGSSMRHWSSLGNIAGPVAIREYNAGGRYSLSKALFGIPALDRGTTNSIKGQSGNYVSNVVNLMDCFQ